MTRRRFLGRLSCAAAVGAVGGVGRVRAQAGGTQVAWGRLVTPHPLWRLHGEQDAGIAAFMQRTAHVNFDSKAYAVDPADSGQLATFPFLYTNTLSSIADQAQRANLREYLRRGGFIMAEACLDHRLNRKLVAFLGSETAAFADLLPGSKVSALPADHPIFRSFFPVAPRDLEPVVPGPGDDRWAGVEQTLYGVQHEGRLAAVIGLQHLQCEWLTKHERVQACLRQFANVYIFAMTR